MIEFGAEALLRQYEASKFVNSKEFRPVIFIEIDKRNWWQRKFKSPPIIEKWLWKGDNRHPPLPANENDVGWVKE